MVDSISDETVRRVLKKTSSPGRSLNTHTPAALYEVFPPEEVRRLTRKPEFHSTPKRGSWLNMVEIEFSVLSRQRLNRRLPDIEMVQREVEAWARKRNEAQATVEWRFTSAAARDWLKRLYRQ